MADQTPKPQDSTPATAGGSLGAGATAPAADPAAMAAEALESAGRAVDKITQATGATRSLDMPEFAAAPSSGAGSAIGLELLGDVNLTVKVELGRTRMYVEDVLRLNTDSVIELDRAAGDPVDIFVNERHVARGEVLVVNDSFCVRVSEVMQVPKSD